MRGKPKLYVDANLRVTESLFHRKAIVNIVNGNFEITFLKPIAHQKNISEAWIERGEWHQRFHTNYPAFLPRAASCVSANLNENEPLFKNCHTSSSSTDFHGRVDHWYMIDSQGHSVPDCGKALENVYVSIWLTKDQFFMINPNVDLSRFLLSQSF